jgi:hypothetical protein
VVEGPPLWVYFLAPAATVVTTFLSLAAAYLLGRNQGRDQLRYEERAKASVEIENRTYEIYRRLRRFESSHKAPTKGEAIELVDKSWDEIDDLRLYIAQCATWLDRNVLIEALRIEDSFERLRTKLSNLAKSDEQVTPEVLVEAIREWREDIDPRRAALSREVQRLLGTGDSISTRLRLWWRRRDR